MTVATERVGNSVSFTQFRDAVNQSIKEILRREDFIGFFTVRASKEGVWGFSVSDFKGN